jgi:CheY-like chemotaxis protein
MAESASASASASSAPPDPVVTPRPTLLLVDDELSVLSALRRLFRTQGYRIEQATSGADALALMQGTPVDLVLSDMRMPGMDGAAFLAQVRSLYPSAARLLLTGYADISAILAAIDQGAIHRYIAKPWDDNDLLLAVSDALHPRGQAPENGLPGPGPAEPGPGNRGGRARRSAGDEPGGPGGRPCRSRGRGRDARPAGRHLAPGPAGRA